MAVWNIVPLKNTFQKYCRIVYRATCVTSGPTLVLGHLVTIQEILQRNTKHCDAMLV